MDILPKCIFMKDWYLQRPERALEFLELELEATMWILEDPMFSRRAASALTHWPISPAPGNLLLIVKPVSILHPSGLVKC